MAEIKTYVCPNCGANTTNTQNCEYCGSLLVRFVEKGIDVNKTSYTNNDNVFPYLIEALKQNIKLQDGMQPVVTDISWVDKTGPMFENRTISILSTSTGCAWGDGAPITSFERAKGLAIVFQIQFIEDNPYVQEVNYENSQKIKRFSLLDSFPLFMYHDFEYKDKNHNNIYCQEYAINFGEDIEGAARLVSEILAAVFRLTPSGKYDIETNVGSEEISASRDAWQQANNTGCAIALLLGLGSTAAAIATML